MDRGFHKGSEFKNISETWDQNERNGRGGEPAGRENTADGGAPGEHELAQMIKEEAAEYDNADKEERILSGNRASVNDDPAGSGAGR